MLGTNSISILVIAKEDIVADFTVILENQCNRQRGKSECKHYLLPSYSQFLIL
jgi:hypothetical protein